MSYFKQLQKIRKKQFPQVIVLYGLEAYFIQNLKDELMKQVIDNNDDNLSTYNLREVPIEEVVADVETYPFFGEKKLVIAHHPTFLTGQRESLPFEHDLHSLEEYIQNPVDYSVLLFIVEHDKLDLRRKLTKLLRDQALVIECNPIKEYEMKKWIESFAKNLGLQIERGAYEIFEREFIPNLYLMQNELLKISTYVGEGGIITREAAELLVSYTEESSAFRLVDAIIDQDLPKALSIYSDLRKLNEEPIGMIALLASQFRIILQVKLLKQKGFSQHQIGRQVRAHQFVVKMANQRERLFSYERLIGMIDQLTKTDARIKRGEIDPDIAIEMLLHFMIHGARVS